MCLDLCWSHHAPHICVVAGQRMHTKTQVSSVGFLILGLGVYCVGDVNGITVVLESLPYLFVLVAQILDGGTLFYASLFSVYG